MNKLLLPKDRPLQLFEEKRRALHSSNVAFDAGSIWEAKRIANEIAMLVHDPIQKRKNKRETKSLLTQLGVKNELMFVSSIAGAQGRALGWSPMIALRFGEGVACAVPACQSGGSFWQPGDVKFRHWWEEVVIRVSGRGLTRKNLIMSCRDQDGGAHVDEAVEADYGALRLNLTAGLTINGLPVENGDLMCIRQIGWEMEQTLNGAFGPLI